MVERISLVMIDGFGEGNVKKKGTKKKGWSKDGMCSIVH